MKSVHSEKCPCIRTELGKIRTRKTPTKDTFQVVNVSLLSLFLTLTISKVLILMIFYWFLYAFIGKKRILSLMFLLRNTLWNIAHEAGNPINLVETISYCKVLEKYFNGDVHPFAPTPTVLKKSSSSFFMSSWNATKNVLKVSMGPHITVRIFCVTARNVFETICLDLFALKFAWYGL